MSRSSTDRMLMRRPFLLGLALAGGIAGAWLLGLNIPSVLRPTALRSALLLDLFVVVPVLAMLSHRIWRGSARVSLDRE